MAACFFYNIFTLALLLLFFLSSDCTEGFKHLCVISLRVPENTSVTAPVMTELKINCNVTKHTLGSMCLGIPSISWCKIYGKDCKALNKPNYIKTTWKDLTHQKGIAILTFLNISMEDAGLYKCKSHNSVSHTINVTVTDLVNSVGFWHYFDICRWTVILTVLLTGVCFIIVRAKSKNDRKETEARKKTTAFNPSCVGPNEDNPHTNISSSVPGSLAGVYINTKDL